MHSEEEYREQLSNEGFTHVHVWQDPSEYFYPDHKHSAVTAHIVLDREMTIIVGGEKRKCFPGDRFDVPAGTIHSALIGSHGCRYMIGEKS